MRRPKNRGEMQSSILKIRVGVRSPEFGFDGCETKCAGCGFIRKKLVASRSKALMVHLYHIFSGWFSVLISCIQAAKPYVDSVPFSWWFTQQRLPMAAEAAAAVRRRSRRVHRSLMLAEDGSVRREGAWFISRLETCQNSGMPSLTTWRSHRHHQRSLCSNEFFSRCQ